MGIRLRSAERCSWLSCFGFSFAGTHPPPSRGSVPKSLHVRSTQGGTPHFSQHDPSISASFPVLANGVYSVLDTQRCSSANHQLCWPCLSLFSLSVPAQSFTYKQKAGDQQHPKLFSILPAPAAFRMPSFAKLKNAM